MTDTQTGMHTHVLGMMQSEDVRPEEGICKCNEKYYSLKARIKGRSGVFVQPELPKKISMKIMSLKLIRFFE